LAIGTEGLPYDTKYLIFQALSHPTRVKILMLIEGKDLTFASLKHEVEIESSGQLQHHLQKLSRLITEKTNGSYGLTDAGKRALDIFRESERSGRPLEDLCCLPTPSELAQYKQVGRTGSVLRLSVGLMLMALTIGIIATYVLTGHLALSFNLNGTSFVSFGVGGAVFFGFFGISFLIASATGYPGCEITAIPNLFARKKRYCSCLITPYNLPDGWLLERVKAQA
jgi:DNA-binding transcriptional ArsR family regulator